MMSMMSFHFKKKQTPRNTRDPRGIGKVGSVGTIERNFGRTPRTPAALTPVPEAEAPSTPMPVLDEPVEACLMLTHPNCLLAQVSRQTIQKPLCQPKAKRNLRKSFFKQMQREENIEECINHQFLNTLFEYACGERSASGDVCDEVGVEGIRLSRNVIDVQDEGQKRSEIRISKELNLDLILGDSVFTICLRSFGSPGFILLLHFCY